jgi:hypothetical protein
MELLNLEQQLVSVIKRLSLISIALEELHQKGQDYQVVRQ